MDIVYLNGDYLTKNNAKVSVFDRGFLFGDGVYEVIPYIDGKFVAAEQHLQRLDSSLNAIQVTSPLSHQQWLEIFQELLTKNQAQHESLNIYLQVTRGTDLARNHAFPKNIEPTIVVFLTPAKNLKTKMATEGFSAITLPDSRRRDCYIKAINLLPNVLLQQEAISQDALEAILIRDGKVLECTSSNVFIVRDGILLTPPLTNTILSGITRTLVLQLAKQHNIPHQECEIPEQWLTDCSEIWVTGSSKEICPITILDNKPVGDGKVGPVWHKMHDIYENYKQSLPTSN